MAGFLGVLSLCAQTQPPNPWRLTRSEHFEVYSQGNDASARVALGWFEQLRAFFVQQTGLKMDGLSAVRVIGFRSAKDYQPYRLRPTSDAYFVGAENRNYIVMPTLDGEFRLAAHEYAHLALHANRLSLPPWLSEGLAELYSTVSVNERGSTLGGDLPSRSQLLQRRARMPLLQLLALPANSPLRADRDNAGLFYAQSWELTAMLVLSPEYRAGFQPLMASLISGTSSPDAITAVYGRPLDTISRDVRIWSEQNRSKPVPLPSVATSMFSIDVTDVTPFEAKSVLADLLLTSSELTRAEAAYRELLRESPNDANFFAALGNIALRKDDRETARREWKLAIEHGVRDATLCYRYATLAQDAGVPADEIRPALERAVALQPGYDDARFILALLEKAATHYETAVAHFRAIHYIAPTRAYAYWIALADALCELGRREEAVAAAEKAKEQAKTTEERVTAAQLAYFAQTDLAVQLTHDGKMVATRAPHGTTDWNSFIEPGDDIRRVQGTLREIECGDQGTRIRVDTEGKRLTLSIPDPKRVLMRNAPADFVCGMQQPASPVKIEYNADGIVRGIEFR